MRVTDKLRGILFSLTPPPLCWPRSPLFVNSLGQGAGLSPCKLLPFGLAFASHAPPQVLKPSLLETQWALETVSPLQGAPGRGCQSKRRLQKPFDFFAASPCFCFRSCGSFSHSLFAFLKNVFVFSSDVILKIAFCHIRGMTPKTR